MNRRHFFSLLASSSALGACSNNVAFKTINSAFETSFGNSSAFDPAYPDQLPYASIAVSKKNMPRALLVLGKAEGDELHWLSADRGVLVTRHGRLIKTVGFIENLSKTEFSSPDFLENHSNEPGTIKNNRIIDLTPGNRYGIKVESKFRQVGRETISIGNKTRETTRYDEFCIAPLLDWQFTNNYWVGDNGQVWRSTQHVTPKAGPITIEITKPYKT